MQTSRWSCTLILSVSEVWPLLSTPQCADTFLIMNFSLWTCSQLSLFLKKKKKIYLQCLSSSPVRCFIALLKALFFSFPQCCGVNSPKQFLWGEDRYCYLTQQVYESNLGCLQIQLYSIVNLVIKSVMTFREMRNPLLQLRHLDLDTESGLILRADQDMFN